MSQTMEQVDHGSLREGEDVDKKQHKSRRPPNTAFRQQRLKAWQPILTPKTVLPLFFAVGIIFAPIGGLLLYASAGVQEINIDYSRCIEDAPACTSDNSTFATIPTAAVTSYFKNSTPDNEVPRWCKTSTVVAYHPTVNVDTSVCRLQFYVADQLTPPILLYYQLTNFYQNHRRYVKSFDQDQLSGTARSYDAIKKSDCDPLQIDNDTQKPFYPCGLIANSLFNDTYSSPLLLNQPGGASNTAIPYSMTNKGVAWSSDARLYGNTSYALDQVVPPLNWRLRYPAYNSSIPFPNLNTDEAFQVWMRTAGLPTFSKLALRDSDDNVPMQVGTYQLDINDNFPVTKYGGTKSILLSTRSVVGGRNPFLGISYVVVGGICILLGAIFTATHLIRPRKLGDHNYLSWNTDQPTTATTSGRAPRAGEANA